VTIQAKPLNIVTFDAISLLSASRYWVVRWLHGPNGTNPNRSTELSLKRIGQPIAESAQRYYDGSRGGTAGWIDAGQFINDLPQSSDQTLHSPLAWLTSGSYGSYIDVRYTFTFPLIPNQVVIGTMHFQDGNGGHPTHVTIYKADSAFSADSPSDMISNGEITEVLTNHDLGTDWDNATTAGNTAFPFNVLK
jgi:hypothetical protein